jgi:hypothetical protein
MPTAPKFKYEYKTDGSRNDLKPETIEADDYDLDTKNGKLTFTVDSEQVASFSIRPGAWVKRVSK